MKKLLTTTFIILFFILLLSSHNSYAFESINNQIVSPNKIWNIQFNKEINFDAVTQKSITVVDSLGDSIAVKSELGTDMKSILIKPPVKGYTLGASYTLKMNTDIYSKDNTKILNPVKMDFKINNNELVENNKNIKTILNDDCSSLTNGGWNKSLGYTADSFIADSSESEKYDAHVPYSQYFFYNNSQDSISKIDKEVSIGAGPFNVEFDAKILDLQTPSKNVGWRGFAIDIVANNKRYHFSLNSKDLNNKIKINLMNNDSGINPFQTVSASLPSDNNTHRWSIKNDGNNAIAILLDGKIIANFNDPQLSAAGLSDRVILYNDMTDSLTGINSVYVENFAIVKALSIKNSTIITDERNQKINISIDMAIEDEKLITNKEYNIKAYLYKNDKIIAESTTSLDKKAILCTLSNVTQSGEMKLVLELVTGNQEIEEATKNINMNIATVSLNPGQTITSSPGSVYLYTQMDKMVADGQHDVVDSGWKLGSYVDSTSIKNGSIIENGENALSIKMPVKLNGWFRVYVGYVTGTESFKIGETNNSSPQQVDGEISLTSNEVYGDQWINEKSTIISNFNNTSIKVNPIRSRKARIAYIKLIGLTDDQVELYQKQNDNKKSVIYDNDGYSDFFSGYYPDVESLQRNAVDKLAGKNVGELNWCLGTTGVLNYNSKYAGNAFDGMGEFDSELRNGDRLAKSQILNILSTGKSPLEIVTNRGLYKGIKVNASLRMDAFYNPTIGGYLNGAIYEKYKQYSQTGGRSLSYFYPEVREYIKNILLEAASYNNVAGITLDFCRYPVVFGRETPTDQKIFIMNEFIRTLRNELPKNKTITVRVPWDNPLQYGFDLNTWIKEGLIDTLVPSSIGNEQFFNVKPYVAMVKDTSVKLYIGISGDVSGHDLTKKEEELIKRGLYIHTNVSLDIQQYLLRAYDIYEAGADGIFLFNSSSKIYMNSGSPIESTFLGEKALIEKWHEFDYISGLMVNKINITKPAL
ncbi:hypothetical protein [Clostridium estertheticum]|uniref:Glycosyl hydrolase-like 10 domain-containing protein n=1 Tax=Clostridium estertheticum TaxID=238834 RepID=A0AA47EM26_9CLOT|nr:hypothetical protein [Clostridium estertheticum]MBU3157188.1 hypothetical protein [Clostridium estertheticum]WAG62697.1 hypothetical protein LL038_10890 [Clostridium estertheticum]